MRYDVVVLRVQNKKRTGHGLQTGSVEVKHVTVTTWGAKNAIRRSLFIISK